MLNRVFSMSLLAVLLPASGSPQTRALAPALQPFLHCRVPGGPELIETTPLLGAPSMRAVQTLHGNAEVHLTDGARLTFAYPGTADFVYMKVEQLEAKTFPQGRADLVSNFRRLVSGDEFSFPNDTLPASVNGFQAMGQDHHELLGGMLAIYLFIDTPTRVAVTIYFPNANPERRKYQSIEEFAKLRDAFLTSYTACARTKLSNDSH